SGGTLVDVGCGQGLMLALLADAARRYRAGVWPAHWARPPIFERLVGIEARPRAATAARTALRGGAGIVEGDVRRLARAPCDAILDVDVLHMMLPAEQDAVLRASAAALQRGGVILVRDADAAAGWRFTAVRVGNRLKAIAVGSWRQRYYYRSAAEWIDCFA